MHAQAGLFSAVLTAFIIDRSQSIQPTPAQQSAFYQQQSAILLNQISQQLSSLGAQIPDSPNSPLPGFTLSPSVSDVRVNTIWIISLVSSLTAALLATLIQQWARDYMHIFQHHSDPLEAARVRQYLYNSATYKDMRTLGGAVPGLVHLSLLLFLAGLADFLFNTYTTVGKSTLFSIVLCGLLYMVVTFMPVINPQSSYRTPCSPMVYFFVGKLRIRLGEGIFGLTLLLGSSMAERRARLAMETSDGRKRRDQESIKWLVNNLTSTVRDAESLTLGIPGSFDTRWGVEVWENESEHRDKLFGAIRRLFETCRNRTSFNSDDEWRARSRACTGTIAAFVFFMGADIATFGDLGKLLSDVGSDGRTREVSEIRSDPSFATRWTCLSLAATRKMLNSPKLQAGANDTLVKLATPHLEDNFIPFEYHEMAALENARRIDQQFTDAWNHVKMLRQVVNSSEEEGLTQGKITEILRQNGPVMRHILGQVEEMERSGMDASLSELQQLIDEATHNLIRRLPGVEFDDFTGSTTPKHSVDFLANPIRPQLMCFSQLLRGLCSFDQEWNSQSFQEMVRTLRSIDIDAIPSSLSQSRLMERQLWRIQDLCYGAFGFTLELYFLSIGKLLSAFLSPLREIHQSIFIKAFRAITSDWKDFKDSIGTQQIILNIVFDIAFHGRGIFSDVRYPDYITKELLDLLRSMIIGQEDAYIEDARKEIHREDLEPSNMNSRFLPSVRGILDPPAPAPAATSEPAPTPTSVPVPHE